MESEEPEPRQEEWMREKKRRAEWKQPGSGKTVLTPRETSCLSFWKKAGVKAQKLDMDRKLKAKRASARDRAKEDNI